MNWRYIKTGNFKIIFPEEAEPSAQMAANLLERSKPVVDLTLRTKSKPIPVLLNNKSVISNGFVAMAPRFMSWYLTPPQDAVTSLDGTDWFYLLSIHEQRHVGQFDKIDTNTFEYIGAMFGESGRLGAALTIPLWYFEGDAVYAETQYSKSGRGRMPTFLRDNFVLNDQGRKYSYNKAVLGSYKDYIPNHYHYGYLMVDHVYRNYGETIWADILNKTSTVPLFSRSLKETTGNNLQNTYKNTMLEYDSIWKHSQKDEMVNVSKTIIAKKNGSQRRTHYIFPQYTGKEEILALKYGFSNHPTLVLLKKGQEQKLMEINYIDRMHSNGNYAIWNQEFYDVRWGELSYSDIMSLDLNTKRKRRITTKQKLYAPAISPDNKYIAAVEYSETGRCALVIVNFLNGNIEKRFEAGAFEYYRMPSWNENSDKIVLTSTNGETKSIHIISALSGEKIFSQNLGFENITNPVIHENQVFFNSPLLGKDQIHSVNTGNGKRHLIIDSKYGVYNPQISETGKIVFQEYDNSGYYICEADLNEIYKEEMSSSVNIENNYLYKLKPLGEQIISPEHSNDKKYESHAYNVFVHSFKVHSWHPVIGFNKIGVKAYSNDILNTTSISAGMDYYPEQNAHREYASIRYAKCFPVFDMALSYGKILQYQEDVDAVYDIDEQIADLKVTLPFNLSSGLYSRNLVVSTGLFIGKVHNNSFEDSVHLISQFNVRSPYVHAEFINNKQYLFRDLNPQFGQEISVLHITSNSASTIHDGRTTVQGKLYFPGLFAHHSVTIGGGVERKINPTLTGTYLLDTELLRVKGHAKNDTYNDYKVFNAEYALPLLYPDVGLGRLIYFKRLHATLFYSQGIYNANETSISQASYGMDLNVEFRLFRLPFPIELGLRFAQRLDDHKTALEFLVFRESF